MSIGPVAMRRLLLASAVIIGALALSGFWYVGPSAADVPGDTYSQAFVERAVQRDIVDVGATGGFMPIDPDIIEYYSLPDDVYLSNFGLQGRVWSNVAEVLGTAPADVPTFISAASRFSGLLLATAIMLVLVFVSRLLGLTGALAAFVAVALSHPLAWMAFNLYWSTALVLLGPAVILCLRLFVLSPRTELRILLVAAFLSVFIKGLAGYEWITFAILANVAAATPFIFAVAATLRPAAVRVLAVGAAATAGFGAALSLHIAVAGVALDSFRTAVAAVFSRAVAHAGQVEAGNEAFSARPAPAEAYPSASALDAFLAYAEVELLRFPTSLNLTQALALVVGLVALATAATLIRGLSSSPALRAPTAAMMFAFSVAGFASWLVLQPSHSVVHTAQNSFMLAALPLPLAVASAVAFLTWASSHVGGPGGMFVSVHEDRAVEGRRALPSAGRGAQSDPVQPPRERVDREAKRSGKRRSRNNRR